MPITADINHDDQIALIRLIGNPNAQEIEAVNRDTLVSFIQEHAPKTVHLVWDVREFEWDFADFVGYLKLAKERRAHADTPTNFKQYYVGQNMWVQSFRSWMQKNYGELAAVFEDTDQAFDYIKHGAAVD